MLDTTTKRRIDDCRDILVGKVPDPKSQIDQITVALIYKFMYDMDQQAVELGGKASFFAKHRINEKEVDYAQYAWPELFKNELSGEARVKLYGAALESMEENPGLPQLFRDIFKNTYLPYRDPATLREFLKRIAEFDYDHSEKLGDAFEYLLSIMGSQGDAGQFRTPRHLIDFMTAVIDPKKTETILDPACGTAGFLISAYKHILRNNSSNHEADDLLAFQQHGMKLDELTLSAKKYSGDKITPDQRKKLVKNIVGYDIDPGMVKLSLVNLYLHGFPDPHIHEYDTLTSTDRWEDRFDVILANPPFMSPKGGIQPHGKFGIPSTRSEVLFVDYIAEHLNPNGRAMVVVPEGVVARPGKAQKALRKKLIEDHYLVGVISIPSGVFKPYSPVKTSLLWFDRGLAQKGDAILFLKVMADGFELGDQRRPSPDNDLPAAFELLVEYRTALATGNKWKPVKGKKPNVFTVKRESLLLNPDCSLDSDQYAANTQGTSSVWPMVAIKDVAEVVSGFGFPLNRQGHRDKAYPFLKVSDMNLKGNERFMVSQNHTVDRDDLFALKARTCPKGTIIFPKIGAAIATNKKRILTRESVFDNNVMGIIPDVSKLLPEYLFSLLQGINLSDWASNSEPPSMRKTKVEAVRIPLPPVREQHALVNEVESYLQEVEALTRQIEEKVASIQSVVARVWGKPIANEADAV